MTLLVRFGDFGDDLVMSLVIKCNRIVQWCYLLNKLITKITNPFSIK